MKKLLLTSICCLFLFVSYAQTVPQGMKYQAVARNNAGQIIENQEISLQVKLQSNVEKPRVHYIETHRVVTNQFGLFTLVIGEGTITEGKFNQVPWSTEDIWMEIAIRDGGHKDFVTISNSKLLAVPYAFHAATANQLVNNSVPISGLNGNGNGNNTPGVPANVWSLFGNSNTNSASDQLGTTDAADLVMITNNIERLRITSDGDINISNSLNVGHNVDIGNDLHVGNNAIIDYDVELNYDGGSTKNYGDFTVKNMSSTYLTGTLMVDKATDLNSHLNVDGQTDLNSALRVNNSSPSLLTGMLTVDGATNLNNSLNVNNGSATSLSGILNVTGATTLSNTLDVTGATSMSSTLDVTGATSLNSTLGVIGATSLSNTLDVTGATTMSSTLGVVGATTLSSTLGVTGATNLNSTLGVVGATTIGGPTTLNNSLAANGQVTISKNLAGGDNSYSAYPLRVEGSAQGIAVKVSSGAVDGSNNFITFFDSNNNAKGRIEGQNAGDVASSPEYIFETAILTAEVVAAGVNIGLSLLPNGCAGVGVVACPPEPSVVAIAIAEEILAIANLAAYQAFAFDNLGVTYESGSADYAEWLEKINISERFTPGDIVGIRGGKITKNTNDVNQYLVVSTNPAVLGNMPGSGQTESYEKIAFMGQVPVKVRGEVKIGDYIIPSGLNDGTGLAVSPEEITPLQYTKIVGIAWSEASLGRAISLVNMAIGLNTNDLAKLVQAQQRKIESLETEFTQLEKRIIALESGQKGNDQEFINEPSPKDEEVSVIEAPRMGTIDPEMVDKAILLLKQSYADRGYDVNNHPGLKKLFSDQSYRKDIIERVTRNYEIDSKNIQAID